MDNLLHGAAWIMVAAVAVEITVYAAIGTWVWRKFGRKRK